MSTQGYKQTLIGPKEKDHQFRTFIHRLMSQAIMTKKLIQNIK